jgi:hypothetical protein
MFFKKNKLLFRIVLPETAISAKGYGLRKVHVDLSSLPSSVIPEVKREVRI